MNVVGVTFTTPPTKSIKMLVSEPYASRCGKDYFAVEKYYLEKIHSNIDALVLVHCGIKGRRRSVKIIGLNTRDSVLNFKTKALKLLLLEK